MLRIRAGFNQCTAPHLGFFRTPHRCDLQIIQGSCLKIAARLQTKLPPSAWQVGFLQGQIKTACQPEPKKKITNPVSLYISFSFFNVSKTMRHKKQHPNFLPSFLTLPFLLSSQLRSTNGNQQGVSEECHFMAPVNPTRGSITKVQE